MQHNLVAFHTKEQAGPAGHSQPSKDSTYSQLEEEFSRLVEMENLEGNLDAFPAVVGNLETQVADAISLAYGGSEGDDRAHLFLQRILYRINRLKLFWYDDLRHYSNERSPYLNSLRDLIETEWEKWENNHLDLQSIDRSAIRQAILERATTDLEPVPSLSGLYFRERASILGYRRLAAIASLDGMVEASQLSRTLGGVGNEIQSMLTRLLLEEYGGGKLARKHSTFFSVMLESLGMNSSPEAYFDLVPWEVLAGINLSFLLSERKRYFLRYVGGLLYTEVSVPAAFSNYSVAAERLNLPAAARGYWDLHIREDERHGQWMIHDVALPLAEMYPDDAWEIIWGYDQQRYVSSRAASAITRSAQAAESCTAASSASAGECR